MLMNKIENSELVKGEYYIVRYNENYIMKFDNIKETYSSCIYLHSLRYENNGSFRFGSESSSNYCIALRKATQKEILWLQECIKANRFIPLHEIKINTTIFQCL